MRARGRTGTRPSAGVYSGFSAACHQMPERSFSREGFPLAVCARCFGLYAGAAAGVLLYPMARGFARQRRAGARVASGRGRADDDRFRARLLRRLGEYAPFTLPYAVLLGAAVAFYIVPAALDLSYRRSLRRASRAAA